MEAHLKDPIEALDKALKCFEDHFWSWLEALWKQSSNDMRSGGVGSDATVVGRGPVALSGCLGHCASPHNLYAMECPREILAVWRALLFPSGQGANGPQGAESARAKYPAPWRASPPFWCRRSRPLCQTARPSTPTSGMVFSSQSSRTKVRRRKTSRQTARIALHRSGSAIAHFLQDWEMAKVALSCHVALDILCQELFEIERRRGWFRF